MKKSEFLHELSLRLKALPALDIKRSVDYYCEMIDDRMEDGLPEEKAVEKIGTPAMAATQIMRELPLITLARARVGKNKSALTTTLIILGSPIWIALLAVVFSLVIAFYAIILSVLAVFFSLFVALWAIEISFAAGAIAGLIGCPLSIFIEGEVFVGLMFLGAALILAALSIFGYFCAIYGTKGLFLLSKGVSKTYKLIFKFIKFCLIRKETIA